MKKSEWAEHLDGFSIVDCAIRSKDIAYVLAVQHDSEEEGDIVWHLISWAPGVFGEDRDIGRSEFFNLRSIPRIAVEFQPDARYILCDTGLFCWVGRQGQGSQPGLMHQMRTLWDEVYFLNSFSLSKRNGTSNQWEEVAIHPAIGAGSHDQTTKRRFLLKDFDAFSPDEFYLLDWQGKVFYQSDGEWNVADLKNLGYPNLQTPGICCGPDGWAYVFGKDEDGGKIFQGRDDLWKVIWESSAEIYHIDMVAYQDYVLISNSIMLSKIKDGKVEDYKTPFTCSHLSVRDNLLMIASGDQAAIYDGKEWKVIISPDFDEAGKYLPPTVARAPKKIPDNYLPALNEYSNVSYEQFILMYPELANNLFRYDSNDFQIYPGDLIIDGDFDLNRSYCGIVVQGNLIIRGALINTDYNFGSFLYVEGRTEAESFFLGGSLLILKEVIIKNICLGRAHYGEFRCDSLQCPVVIFDDYYGPSADESTMEFYFNSELSEGERAFGHGLDTLIPAFGDKPWLHYADEPEYEDAEDIDCELDSEAFYKEVMTSPDEITNVLATLRRVKAEGRLVSPATPKEEEEYIPEPCEFWGMKMSDMEEAYQREGITLRNKFCQLGTAHQSGDLSVSKLKEKLSRLFTQHDRPVVLFACEQLFLPYDESNSDISVRPYVFVTLINSEYKGSLFTIYYMLYLVCHQQLNIIIEELGRSQLQYFDEAMFHQLLNIPRLRDIQMGHGVALSNVFRLLEANLGRASAFDIVDQVLLSPDWYEDIYHFLWSFCYKAERDEVYPGFAQCSQLDMERGMNLATGMLLMMKEEGQKYSSRHIDAGIDYLAKFQHPQLFPWKKRRLQDEQFLNQFNFELDGKNVKKELIKIFRKAIR